MEYILLAMIVLVITVAVMAMRLTDNSYPFPFNCKSTLFTQAEHNFLELLKTALGNEYRVMNRVKLADLLVIRNGVSDKAKKTALMNAQSKYLDFVICDAKTMAIVGALDLVDTNGAGYKVKKDWFVSGALESAAIPHIRIKVKNNYSVEEVQHCIKQKLRSVQLPTDAKKPQGIKPIVKKRPTRPISGVIAPSLVAPPANAMARLPH